MRFQALFIVALLFVCIEASAGQFSERSVNTADGARTFWIYLPADQPEASMPVVFVFHGDGGSSQGIASATGFNTFAEQNSFIVIYPQASMVGDGVRFNTYVDQQPGHAGFGLAQCPDDIEFTQSILNWLNATYSLTLSRVYASGHSGGGFMCYNLAIQMRAQFTAIAPVSASMWGDNNFISAKITSGAWTSLPVMHIHGKADAVVDYPDKDGIPKAYEEWPLSAFSVGACGADTYTDDQPYLGGTKYIFCSGTTPVWLVGIDGMRHTWTNGVYPTTESIVSFFNLGMPSSVEESGQTQTRRIIVQESHQQLELPWLEADEPIRIYDINGSTVFEANVKSLISKHFQPGFYAVIHPNNTSVVLLVY